MRDPVAFAADTINHVTQHATGADVFVVDDHDRDAVVAVLRRAVTRFGLELHDFCVMTNHVHLVVRAPGGDLPRAMQYLWSCVVQRFNRRHGRRGHLVQAPYVPTPILSDEHYLSTRAYVAMNPVEAGLCSHPSAWRWCGFTAGCCEAAAPFEAAVRLLVEARLELLRLQ
jgi:putative transposase